MIDCIIVLLGPGLDIIVASCAVGVRSVVGVSMSLLLRSLQSGRLEHQGNIEEHTLYEA